MLIKSASITSKTDIIPASSAGSCRRIHHLPLYFPEFTRYWYSTPSTWFIRFLERFPIPAAIRALGLQTFIVEAWDVAGRFRHHRQFLKYCGLDLAKSQSGQNKGHEVLSKRGNKRLRLAFWMAGLVTIHQRENVFRDKYERYLRATPFDADRKRRALLPALFRTTNSQWIDPSRSSR